MRYIYLPVPAGEGDDDRFELPGDIGGIAPVDRVRFILVVIACQMKEDIAFLETVGTVGAEIEPQQVAVPDPVRFSEKCRVAVNPHGVSHKFASVAPETVSGKAVVIPVEISGKNHRRNIRKHRKDTVAAVKRYSGCRNKHIVASHRVAPCRKYIFLIQNECPPASRAEDSQPECTCYVFRFLA